MRTCLTVMAARQSSSSFRMLRQTVPDGYTFGWNNGGVNLHFGGLLGYSSVNSMVSGYTPPSQIVSDFPGIPQLLSTDNINRAAILVVTSAYHFMRFVEPSADGSGRAKKPYGCSFRHCFRSSFSLPRAIPPEDI